MLKIRRQMQFWDTTRKADLSNLTFKGYNKVKSGRGKTLSNILVQIDEKIYTGINSKKDNDLDLQSIDIWEEP